MPSIDFICTPPLPTTPKLAAVPSARSPGAWGDHFTQVYDTGYLTAYCLKGFSIYWYNMTIL